MGLISTVLEFVFGGGRNALRETAEVFRENAEAGAVRAVTLHEQALAQFASEFQGGEKSRFDRFIDGVNRLPRPALALGTLGLFVTAMIDPIWFASRMQGIALVPQPLWWLLGVIVSFYFGARHQAKVQEFEKQMRGTLRNLPEVLSNLEALNKAASSPGTADPSTDVTLAQDASAPQDNPALDHWRTLKR